LTWVGVGIALVGGFGATFERHLGRQLGFSILVEIGFAVATVGLRQKTALFFEMALPRTLSLGAWALALAVLKPHVGGLFYHDVHGKGRSWPAVTGTLFLAQLSVAGFPLLAGFPVRMALWNGLAATSFPIAIAALLASAGLVAASLRSLTVLITGPEETEWKFSEPLPVVLLLGLAVLALFMVGIFPQAFLPSLAAGVEAFSSLVP
jgi:NADH:ubiquinone oxidoreductase subunit 2 (subunit N)